jgi:hypothetical protein
METRVSLAELSSIKAELLRLLPHVKSSHRIEALARGLGWNTYAAMRLDLAQGARNRKVDEERFTDYLHTHGFAGIPKNLLRWAIPELAEIEAIWRREVLSDMPDTLGELLELLESDSTRAEQWAEALDAATECRICGVTIVMPSTFASAATSHYAGEEFDEKIPWRIELALEAGSCETGGGDGLCHYHAEQFCKDD